MSEWSECANCLHPYMDHTFPEGKPHRTGCWHNMNPNGIAKSCPCTKFVPVEKDETTLPLLGGPPIFGDYMDLSPSTGTGKSATFTVEEMQKTIATVKTFADLPPLALSIPIGFDAGETWEEAIANKKSNKKIPVVEWTQQAQHFMKNSVKVDSMSVNGHQLETILVAFAEKMNAELMTRIEQIVQSRVDDELLKKAGKVPSTFKKNNRKFRPTEV